MAGIILFRHKREEEAVMSMVKKIRAFGHDLQALIPFIESRDLVEKGRMDYPWDDPQYADETHGFVRGWTIARERWVELRQRDLDQPFTIFEADLGNGSVLFAAEILRELRKAGVAEEDISCSWVGWSAYRPDDHPGTSASDVEAHLASQEAARWKEVQ